MTTPPWCREKVMVYYYLLFNNNSDRKSGENIHIYKKVKVKSSMDRSLPVENLLPQNVGSIINYLQ